MRPPEEGIDGNEPVHYTCRGGAITRRDPKLLNFSKVRTADTWILATLHLCKAQIVDTEAGRFRYPEQWAWFLWEPASQRTPTLLPSGWGITDLNVYDDVCSELGGALVYELGIEEVNRGLLLDVLLYCEDGPDHMMAAIRTLRTDAAIDLRTRIREAYSEIMSPAAQSFYAKLLSDIETPTLTPRP